MDVFKIDQPLRPLGASPNDSNKLTAVTFDTTTDFGLNFFDPSSPPPHHSSVKSPDSSNQHDGGCVFDATDSLFSPSPSSLPSTSDSVIPKTEIKQEFLPPYPGETSPFGADSSNCSVGDGVPITVSPLTVASPSSTSPPTLSILPPAYESTIGIAGTQSPSAIVVTSSAAGITVSHKPTMVIKTEQNFVAADSNTGSSPSKSFVPCKVCGDKASGYHYGVTSCEGCKGFFRRSIQKQIEYRCLRDGRCLVIRLNRNRCQFCRFKKCLAVGMSRDSVRYGRVPKRSRERSEEMRVSSASEAEQVTTSRELDQSNMMVYDILLTVSQAHHAHCAYTEEKTRNLVRKPAVFPVHEANTDESAATSTADMLEQQRIAMWQTLARLITPSLQQIVEFAKRVPGFLELREEDQLILLRLSFFELWLTHMSRLVSSLDNTVTFSDGTYVTRQQMVQMFDAEFVSSMFSWCSSLTSLGLNDSLMSLLCGVILLSPDRPGITDARTIQQVQEKIKEALKIQTARNYAAETQTFASLMVRISELRNLGVQHSNQLQWYRRQWRRLVLPPLFAEIFDVFSPDESPDDNYQQ